MSKYYRVTRQYMTYDWEIVSADTEEEALDKYETGDYLEDGWNADQGTFNVEKVPCEPEWKEGSAE